MNKNKIAMCSIGGVALIAAAALGYFIYAAYADRAEKLDDLDSSAAAAKRINSAKISPGQASIDAIEENTKLLKIWTGEALHVASEGDEEVDADMTPEAFKRLLVDEARVEAARPGGVDGKIVKDGFAFGFKDYISGGAMPERERLAFLQRQWQDVKFFTKTLSDAGVIEIVDIVIGEKKAPEAEAEPKRGQRGKKPAQEEVKPPSDEQRYDIKFKARAPAFIKVVNAFATSTRFTTVDAFSFVRAEDSLAAALGEKDKDSGGGGMRARGGRGRGRGMRTIAPEGEEPPPEEGGEEGPRRKGLVTDPKTEAPFIVSMTLSTHDFGMSADHADERAAAKAAEPAPEAPSAEAQAEEAPAEPVAEPAADQSADTPSQAETTEKEAE